MIVAEEVPDLEEAEAEDHHLTQAVEAVTVDQVDQGPAAIVGAEVAVMTVTDPQTVIRTTVLKNGTMMTSMTNQDAKGSNQGSR